MNGLQNHTDSETDKTVSEADNDVGKTTIHDDAGKTTAQLSNKTADDKNTDSDDDNSDSDNSDEVVPVVEPRPAKVIAGEVIKHWQTKTRSKGFSVAVLICFSNVTVNLPIDAFHVILKVFVTYCVFHRR